MKPGEAEAALFGEALACEERRPAGFAAGPHAAADLQAERLRAEAFLQALALVEDSRSEEPEEHGTTGLALQRIEARLDLLTTLVGSLLRGHDHDAVRPLRWSALGASLQIAGTEVAAGASGWLRVQPSDWLPQVLRLPVEVLAAETDGDGRRLWLRFEGLGPGLSAALERHLFRVHRREIAERRRSQ
ncbi:MAG TPA: PilZ domain-containing protein [Xanthomonadaceae bacterium]|nr:PilZ domain-containing protein [Xanthomonadaceae bacterium]